MQLEKQIEIWHREGGGVLGAHFLSMLDLPQTVLYVK